MTKLLTSSWMTIVISGLLYLGVTVVLWKTPKPRPAAGVNQEDSTHSAANGPSWEFINPEADQLVAELKSEKQALAKKGQEIANLNERLQAERSELNAAMQTVRQLQADFDQNVVRVHEDETINLKKLAKVYADMAPESAANIFAEMDDSSVVKIMVFMKDGETAGIFEALSKKGQPDAKRAASLSEKLRLAVARNPAAK
jgi:flagellar motility protein MotE (MotC chaperone)